MRNLRIMYLQVGSKNVGDGGGEMRFANEIMMIQEGVYEMSIYSPRVSKMQKCFSSLSNFRINSAYPDRAWTYTSAMR